VACNVKKALEERKFERLQELALEHKHIMDSLSQAGPCKDPQMLNDLTCVSREIEDVVLAIRASRDEIGLHIRADSNRKRLSAAYGTI